MTKAPQGKIKTPCPVSWQSMDKTTKCNVNFCQNCQKEVFDITDLAAADILDLYQKAEGNLCVRMPLESKRKSIFPKYLLNNSLWKTGSRIGLVALGLFLGNSLYAQKHNFSNYEISQVQTVSNTIIISGEIKGKKKIGWRNQKEAYVFVYTEDGKTLIGSCESDARGQFILEIDKKEVRENLKITISSDDYSTLTISRLKCQNTSLQISLRTKKSDYFVTGRFF